MFKNRARAFRIAATGGVIALLLAATGLAGAGLSAMTPAAGTPWIGTQASQVMQAARQL
jgi:hypothetical protein